MMTRRTGSLTFLWLLVALIGPTVATGQSVSGTILDSEQDVPIPGTFVLLLDDEGKERARTLTTQAGTFRVGAPGPGSYRIRVQRIGVSDVTTDLFTLDDGDDISRQIRVSLVPVRLAGLEVEVEADPELRCGMVREEAIALYRVWEEARKALEATVWTGQQTYYRFDILLSRRDLDRRGVQSGETEFEPIRVYGRHPFRSVPADDLAFGGWVRATNSGSVLFHAPDAAVLLSESFLQRHCYNLQRDQSDGRRLIGVHFEPMAGRRLSDISGVLWIDMDTGELRSLDFQYVLMRVDFETDQLGGHVDFDRLPNGAWIVQRWIIRTPIARLGGTRSFSGRRRRAGIRLAGIYEEGQQVTAVWRTGFLQAGPGNDLPEDVPPANAPTDRIVVRYPSN